jgi:hypothetical protein
VICFDRRIADWLEDKLADLDYFSLDEPQDYTSQQLVICPPKTQIKRPRIQDASSSAPRTLILPSELQRKKEIRDCIFNLFGAISNGEEQIPFGFVECLVDTFVVSPIGTTKSSKPRATSQDLLCKYHKAESKRVESNSAASMKAVRILQLADAFALKKPALADEYELEWDLWFDPVIRLPSQDFQSKNHAGSESGGGINDAQVDPSSCTTSAPANRTSAPHVKHRQVTVLSKMAGHGRTDILTSTQFTVGQPEINEYAAEVILTLPSKELGSAQIRFLLWQQANLGSKTLRTPMISASQLRPNDSKIFEIAAVGTKEALIQMFMTREASIGDRDMCGRFLINVSHFRLCVIYQTFDF